LSVRQSSDIFANDSCGKKKFRFLGNRDNLKEVEKMRERILTSEKFQVRRLKTFS
jgi:hypothetical protein